MASMNVEVDLNDIDTEDIISHLEYKGYLVMYEEDLKHEVDRASPFMNEMQELFDLKTSGNDARYEEALKNLFYNSIGRIL